MSTKTASKSTARSCTCGCGTPLVRKTSNYAPGHDAKHAGIVAREIVATGKTTLVGILPSAALRHKATQMVERLSNPKAAVKQVKATATKPVQPVKVGRWTYPAMIKDGALLRNTKRDGSGEWIAA